MPEETLTKIAVENNLRDDAEKVLQSLGISLGEAVNIFLNRLVEQNDLPIEVKIPNPETINLFKQTEQEKGKLKTCDTPEELFEKMDKW